MAIRWRSPRRQSPRTPDQYKVVGTSPPRFDVEGKVFGTTPWVSDIRVAGMLHGRMIRPPIPGASVVSVDEIVDRRYPGRARAAQGRLHRRCGAEGMGCGPGVAKAPGYVVASQRSLRRHGISFTRTSATRPRPSRTRMFGAKSIRHLRTRRVSWKRNTNGRSNPMPAWGRAAPSPMSNRTARRPCGQARRNRISRRRVLRDVSAFRSKRCARSG